MTTPILVQKVSKRFRRYAPERPTTFLETLIHGFRGLKPAEEFWALREVTFAISPGKMVGIVGPNGAGKSTLLRLIGGVGKPDSGSVQTYGRIGALLDLGAGFHPDLTGRENVFITGVISGLTRREVQTRFDEIVAFAELAEFIDNPLRTYSTGMQMRLAFAVAVHIEPEILLIDEVLAVGDIAFQRKCLERIAEFKANGCAIVLVSHDPGVVQQLCDEVIWLKNGFIAGYGPAEIILGQYKAEMNAETRRRTPRSLPNSLIGTHPDLKINENRFGSLEMEITEVTLIGGDGLVVEEFTNGHSLTVQITYHAPRPILSPIFSMTISKENGAVCFDTSTDASGVETPWLSGTGKITVTFDRLDLARNIYYVDVGVYENAWAYAYDYHWHVYPLRVTAAGGDKGILYPPHHWNFSDGGKREWIK
ncbi:MAG TPA: ABC transporter ATP-binding protein [Anaerolineales bacterium]|nr:ABC transporter ATP-binding protein [Anaerolineales bacterium]